MERIEYWIPCSNESEISNNSKNESKTALLNTVQQESALRIVTPSYTKQHKEPQRFMRLCVTLCLLCETLCYNINKGE